MPYPNEHAARLQDPDKYDKYTRTSGGNLYGTAGKVPSSIDIIWGHPKGKPPKIWVAQALRFPTSSWTAAGAKKWLADNKIKYSSFETATKSEEFVMNLRNIKERLDRYQKAKKEEKERAFHYQGIVIKEKFASLRDALEKAVKEKFGKHAYLNDFSPKEAIIGYDSESGRGPSYTTGVYHKVEYKFVKDVVSFGAPEEVKKVTTYEQAQIGLADFVELTMCDLELRREHHE